MRFEDLVLGYKSSCHAKSSSSRNNNNNNNDEDLDGSSVISIHRLFGAISSPKDDNDDDENGDISSLLRQHQQHQVVPLLRILRQRSVYPPNLSPLHQCVRIDRADRLELLLKSGASANALESGSSMTALHLAVVKGMSSKFLETLVGYGADLRARGRWEEKKVTGTPLEMAIKMGGRIRSEIVETLERFENGGDSSSSSSELKEMFKGSVDQRMATLIGERDKAVKVWTELDRISKELRAIAEGDPERGAIRNSSFELGWKSEYLEASPDFRTRSRLAFLDGEIASMRGLRSELTAGKFAAAFSAVRSAMLCPVCLDLPKAGPVHDCQTCSNLICSRCIGNVVVNGNRCPSCRQDFLLLPLLRNRLAERIIEAGRQLQ